jgi:hypothetical protein
VIQDEQVVPVTRGTMSRRRALRLFLGLPAAFGLAPRVARAVQSARKLVRGEPIYSESVYLDGVTADGRSGFVLRIGRFPEARVAWLWGHVFTPQTGMLAFLDHQAPDSDARTVVESDEATYRGSSGSGEEQASLAIVRSGSRLSPRGATLSARWPMRSVVGQASEPAGATWVALQASWQPRHPVFESLTGRSEALGVTEAKLRFEEREVSVRGFGHFHEQHQEAPRFTTPFVYATLRGVRFSCVAMRSRGADRGFAVRDPGSPPIAISKLGISPPGESRRLRLELADGSVLLGMLEATYRYTNPLFGVTRQASVVRGEVGGEPVTGCVNDFLESELEYL